MAQDHRPRSRRAQPAPRILAQRRALIRDDAVYYNMVRFSALRPYTPPSAVEEIFRAKFDGAWEEGGLFLLTMHPHVSGHRSRLPVVERLITHMKAKGAAGSRPTRRRRSGARCTAEKDEGKRPR
jgi:hypothetical protein